MNNTQCRRCDGDGIIAGSAKPSGFMWSDCPKCGSKHTTGNAYEAKIRGRALVICLLIGLFVIVVYWLNN